MSINIHKKYLPISTDDSRYFVVTGGRGSGKSFAVTVFLTLLTMSKNIRVLFTRFTMVSAHLSIIPEFLEKIGLLGFDEVFSINKAEVVNTSNQSDILFRGIRTSAGNQTASLKSLQGISTWVLDEAEELVDENIFDTIDLSIFQRTIKISKSCTDIFGIMLSIGLSIQILSYAFLHAGVVTGLVPTTGIQIPLISFFLSLKLRFLR